MARYNEEIQRLTAKFSGKSAPELMEDPEFQQLTPEDLQVLAVRLRDAKAVAAEHGLTAEEPPYWVAAGQDTWCCVFEGRIQALIYPSEDGWFWLPANNPRHHEALPEDVTTMGDALELAARKTAAYVKGRRLDE